MALLSIIIPHYNSPELLNTLLRTIPDNSAIEVLVIDDLSTKKLEEYTNLKNAPEFSHIHFHTNDSGKKGAGACRNIGVRKSSGQWLLFADSDDYFTEGFYDIVKEYFTSDNEVVYFTPTSMYLDTGLTADRHVRYAAVIGHHLQNPNRLSELHLRYSFAPPWSKLIRKQIITDNDILFDEIIASNDLMFSTKLGNFLTKFAVSDKTIYCITRSKGSLTTSRSIAVFDARLHSYIDYWHFLNSHLPKKDIKHLNVTGIWLVINSIKYRFGLRKTLSVFYTLLKNKLPLISLSQLRPEIIANKIGRQLKEHKNMKKYLDN